MPKIKGALSNPLPCGISTYSNTPWACAPNGYNYRNELKTIHPDYAWVKYVAYVVVAEKKGEKATRAGYFRTKYRNPNAAATNVNTWNALSNAGYIAWDARKKTYLPTVNAHLLMEFIEMHFGAKPKWNR